MWLINTTSLVLEFIEDPDACIYAILSHTWGEDEVSFQDMADLERARKKKGFSKIERTCQLARDRNIEYAWVDTCCIDKSSSAELTEAINSMFRWYKRSHICFVFLSDLLSFERKFFAHYLPRCRWFTRGWTLQELIASREIEFYDRGWNLIGTNDSLLNLLVQITEIDVHVLNDSDLLQTVPVARRMSWAASRQTSRVEDLAYCLFGIFDVHLPLIYGEGQKAFIRLQEAIAQEKNDLSLFAWISADENLLPLHRRREFRGILAESPSEFKDCSNLSTISDPAILPAQVSITNQGFDIKDRLSASIGEYYLNLDCNIKTGKDILDTEQTIIIKLVRTAHAYVRHDFSRGFSTIYRNSLRRSAAPRLPISKTITQAESQIIKARLRHRISIAVVNIFSGIQCSIQMRPQHLWDQSSSTFITDGYEAFTGIVEVKTRGRRGMKYNVSIVDVSSFLIFGYAAGNFGVAGVDNEPRKQLVPWAGIFAIDDKDVSSHTVPMFDSEETFQWIPNAIHKVREIVLARVDSGRSLPTVCELGTFRLDNHSPRVSVQFQSERAIRAVLSTERDESPEGSIYRIALSLE